MSESVVIDLIDMFIKVLPNAISFIQGLIGDGGSITPEHVPQILSHMADISKTATDLSNSGIDAATSVDAIQSLANEHHNP